MGQFSCADPGNFSQVPKTEELAYEAGGTLSGCPDSKKLVRT